MKKLFFATLCIVSSSIFAGENPDVIIKGNVHEYREAGPGETVRFYEKIPDEKKNLPEQNVKVTATTKSVKGILQEIPSNLLIGELARRGISTAQKETLNCGGISSVDRASIKKRHASKSISRKNHRNRAKK